MTLFREADKKNGKEGELSTRRVLAFLSFLMSFIFFGMGLLKKELIDLNFVPGIAFLIFATILLLFTTSQDIVELLKAWKK